MPVLLSEVSSPKTRGAVGSVHQLMINLGVLCSGLLGYSLVEDVPHGWRYVQGFIVVPAVAQVCTVVCTKCEFCETAVGVPDVLRGGGRRNVRAGRSPGWIIFLMLGSETLFHAKR